MNDGTIGTWSYRAGDWFAVFGARTTLLLPESERARVVGLWALVDEGADFTQVLDGLLASGLSALQGFALVSTDEGPTRVLLRGDGVRASLTTESETVELEGAGSTTWVERSVDGVTGLQVTVTDSAAEPDFPIVGGLVRVSRIDLPPAGRPAPEFEGDTVLPPAVVAVEDEPSPLTDDLDDDQVTEPPPPPPPPVVPEEARDEPSRRAPDYMQPWPEPEDPGPPPRHAHPEAAPSTAHIPIPPTPPPPYAGMPPPSPPEPGPWGDGGFADAPPPPPPPPPAGPAAPEPEPVASRDSDHDGLTQAGVNAEEFALEQPGIPGQPMAPSVTRPVAKLIVSNGETVDVDRVVLIGRAPEARRFTSTEQPTLVTVPSPMHEISSTHVEVRPGSGADHGSAVVTDMGSTNGTVLVQPGLPPEDLKPGIAVQLIPGAIINLGDGLTIQVARP